jgi:hypothetical protein
MTQADIFNHQTTMTDRSKIIVLDDDPTGSQTVHSCLLLTKWDVETLKIGLMDEVAIFFILTNTRALPAKQAAAGVPKLENRHGCYQDYRIFGGE